MSHIENSDYTKFKKARKYSYSLLYWGVWISIFFFVIAFLIFAINMGYMLPIYSVQYLSR